MSRLAIIAKGPKISQRGMKCPLKYILEVEMFDVSGVDFIRHFPSSRGNEYILVIMEYVLKLVKALASPTNDS